MFQFEPIEVATGSQDRDGRLVLRDGALMAVLVRLDDPAHGEERGRWHLEATFNGIGWAGAPLFENPEAACLWLRDHAS
ncbi:hypothetical protein [Aureimonas populi]|uniref:Uncharacterized protein n=1 Tax=Aureimonas populi TaxID=1701758 RepID=A0ABW5CMQ3_9HYPH|nr:hypothetical protein [Aureimonas populi]